MARSLSARPILDVARDLDLTPAQVVPYGSDKAKVTLDALESGQPAGRLVLVSAITPTDAGEGKTTTSIGLVQGLARLGQRVCLALREPSLGPTFGQKGGATGGGQARVVPESDINLHFTGDFHAIGSAHNLLAVPGGRLGPIAGVTLTRERQASGDRSHASYRRRTFFALHGAIVSRLALSPIERGGNDECISLRSPP